MSSEPYTPDRAFQDPSDAADTADTGDAADVAAVVRAYIDSWHTGDAQGMERSLDDDLVKRGVIKDAPTPDALPRVTKAQMVQLTRDGGGRSPGAEARVLVHHVEGGIASAQVATEEYLDYLHLAKTSGAWRIVHDLFRQTT